MAFQTVVSDLTPSPSLKKRGTEENIGEQTVITLKDLENNTFAEIYAHGALLNQFYAENNETSLNVIDGFSSPGEATEKIKQLFKSAKLSPYACRVKDAEYKFGEKKYHLTKHSLQGHAIHGLLFDADFSITEQYSDETAAAVKLEYVYDNNNEGYPFRYRCEVEYKLSAGNALTITTTVTNIDNQLMPVVDGWHPYFTLGDTIDNYQLEFQSKEMLEFDENLLPTGKLFPFQQFGSLKDLGTTVLDNCFTLNFAECQPMCVLRNPLRKVQVEFHPSPSYPYLQVYTPQHRKSIAIENLSAAPDAFNNGIGLKVLEADEAATFSTMYKIRFL